MVFALGPLGSPFHVRETAGGAMKTTIVRISENRYAQLTAALLIFGVVFTPNINADSVTYTLRVTNFPGDVGPSGDLIAGGNILSFGGANGNAVLTFTFQGDTSNVVPWSVSVPNPTTAVNGFEILAGTASFQITNADTGASLAQGTFLPSDGIFVSVDNSNASMGFGSFAVANQNDPSFRGLPTYPYGLAFGTGLDTYDMKSNFTVSQGDLLAFSCVGFPQSAPVFSNCLNPVGLATTAGDLFVNASPAFHDQTGSFTAVTSVPEPDSLLLLGMGLLGLMMLRKTDSFSSLVGARNGNLHP